MAKDIKGILNTLSGSISNIVVQSNGVIRVRPVGSKKKSHPKISDKLKNKWQ